MADQGTVSVKFISDVTGFKKGIREVEGGLDKTTASINKFKAMLGGIASGVAAAFTVREIVKFAGEAAKLAAEMEGVKTAFDKLNNPTLLDDLRKATRGTVDDLKLMQTAVKANNFKIPRSEEHTSELQSQRG
jgi:hypothetical protein